MGTVTTVLASIRVFRLSALLQEARRGQGRGVMSRVRQSRDSPEPKFKPPRRGDIAQWAKIEALVKLGFRFDTLYDADGAIVRYPSTARGIT